MPLPPAPMPPMPDFNHGPFDGVPEGPPLEARNDYPFPDDDYDRRGGDMFDSYEDFDRKPRKTKKKDKDKEDKSPVEVKYEGYMLERAPPLLDEKPTWARIGKRALPFDGKLLVDIAKRRRGKTRFSPNEDFKQLSSNQQGVVNRLILERKQQEKNKHADWVLYDVQRFMLRSGWKYSEVKKIQVILKRVDKNPSSIGEGSKSGAKSSYQDVEIIDLAVDPNKKIKKEGNKKLKKAKSFDDFDPLDDPLGLGLGIPPPPPNHGHNHNDHQEPRGSRDMFEQMPPPPPNHPPPHAFPVEQSMPNQFPPGFQPQFPPSARQSFHNPNPFQPNPDVASPMQFESPPMGGNDWPHPHPHQHHGGVDRVRARSTSRTRDRRPSNRRTSIDARRIQELEEKVDNLSFDVRNRRQIGSDSSEFDEDSIFDSPPSDGRSFTPPSSPRSYFSDAKARGSLERRRSSASRDPRYHARYRSHRYQDTEIEPANSYRSDRRRDSPEYRRHAKRPSLHHANTYDDYPSGRGADPRRPPALPAPRPLQRRLTYDPDSYDYRNYDVRRQSDVGDLRDFRDSRRRPADFIDPVREAYEAGRRDSALDSGRRGYGGGGDYYR